MAFRLLHPFFIMLLAAAAASFSCGEGDSKPEPSLTFDLADAAAETTSDVSERADFILPADRVAAIELPDFSGVDAPDPCELEPGYFGCPCKSNTDCESGFCVAAGGGSVCTTMCLEECPLDWACTGIVGFGSDLVFLCVPPQQALCGAGTDPGLMYSCSATWPLDPEPGEPFVTCYGFKECTASGWSECLLPEELCDNLDNNCDGQADEGFVNDEGKYDTTEHCGQCNNNCTFLTHPSANGVCNADLPTPACAMECL